MPDLETTVEKFSPFWWQTSGLTFLLIPVILWILFRQTAHNDRIRLFMGFNLLYFSLTLLPYHLWFESGFEARFGLPFHLCRIAAWVVIIALFTRKQWAYEAALFLAIMGGFNALFTPQYTQGTFWYFVLEFYWSHALLIISPLFLTFNYGMRPRKWAWLRAFLLINVFAFVVYWINVKLGTNYMFLVEAPKAKSPFLFTKEWPDYIFGMELGVLLFFLVIYTPFYLAERQSMANLKVSTNKG